MENKINAQLLNQFITDLYSSTNLKDIGIEQGTEMFLNNIKITKRYNTYLYYCKELKKITNYLKSRGITSFMKITNQIILDFIKINSHLNACTINKHITAIKTTIKYLEEMEIISHIDIKIKKLKEIKPEIKIIDKESLIKILKLIDNKKPIQKIALLLLITTGIRRSELIKIKIKNINLKENNIYLEETKTGDTRYIFIDDNIKHLIEEYLKDNNDIYLFTNPITKDKVSVSFVDCLIARVKKELNIEKLSPHKFRHTYATMLLENGADIESVRLLLGHRTYEMTKRYLHIKNEKLKNISLNLNPSTIIK